MGISFSVRSLLLAPPMLLAPMILAVPVASSAQIILSIGIAPPPLPVYEQTICPSAGYIWTPGYWAYAQEGYFWVPGTWEMAPEPGLLWTPGYWGWGDNAFVFNEGYWGAQVGFYGGIDYGFGYAGVGYQGGYWNNGAFFYNRSVNNITNVTNITNVYNKTVVVNNVSVRNVSYNGGAGGVSARPTAEEQKATGEKHVARTSAQVQHVQTASTNKELYESANHGKPAIAATAKPGEFSGKGVVAAKAAAPSYKPVTARAPTPATAKGGAAPAAHASEIKPAERAAPNTGNPQLDKKYQAQQTKLNASQGQERQQLQKKQDQDHQKLTQSKASDATKQQVEVKHQQQTQQVAQKHEAQQQKLQVKQQPVVRKAPPAKPVAAKPVAEKKE